MFFLIFNSHFFNIQEVGFVFSLSLFLKPYASFEGAGISLGVLFISDVFFDSPFIPARPSAILLYLPLNRYHP